MIGNDIANGIKNVASAIVNNTIYNIKDQLMPTITSTAPKALSGQLDGMKLL